MLSFSLYAQNESFNIDFGEGKDDFVAEAVERNDIVYSLTKSVCNNGSEDYTCSYLIAFDSNGNILNQKQIDVDPNHRRRIMQLSGDTLVLASSSLNDTIPCINLKYFDVSTFLEIKNSDFSLEDKVNFYGISSVLPLDNHIVLAGWTQLTDNPDEFPDYCIYLNKENLEIDTILEFPFQKESCIYEYLFTPDGKQLIAYFSLLAPESSKSARRGFIKYDQNRNMTWFYYDTLNFETQHNYEHAAELLNNQNLIYKHKHTPTDFNVIASDNEIVCIDSTGEIIWTNNTLSISPFGRKHILTFEETSNGDILCGGYVLWHFNYPGIELPDPDPDSIPPFPDPSDAYTAPYLVKLNGTTGQKIWEYALIEYDQFGNVATESLSNIFELSNKTLFGAGSYINSTESNQMHQDSWFTILDSEVCTNFEFNCGFEAFLTHIDNDPDDIPNEIIIYPNPFHEFLNIEWKSSLVKSKITLINSQMKSIKSYVIHPHQDLEIMQTMGIPSGTYYLLIEPFDRSKPSIVKLLKF